MEETSTATNTSLDSSIIPQGSRLEPIRAKNHVWAPIIGIEVVHVICFIILVAFIFKSLWSEAKSGKKS